MFLDRPAFAAWLMRKGTPDAFIKPYTEGANRIAKSIPPGEALDEAAIATFIANARRGGASENKVRNYERIGAALLEFAALVRAGQAKDEPVEIDEERAAPPRERQATPPPLEAEPPDPDAKTRRLIVIAAGSLGLVLVFILGQRAVASWQRRAEDISPRHTEGHLRVEIEFPGASFWRRLPSRVSERRYDELFPPVGVRSRSAVVRGVAFFRGDDPRRAEMDLELVTVPIVADVWGTGRHLTKELVGFGDVATRAVGEQIVVDGGTWRPGSCDLRQEGKAMVLCRGSLASGVRAWDVLSYVVYGRDEAVVAYFRAPRMKPEFVAEAESVAASLRP